MEDKTMRILADIFASDVDTFKDVKAQKEIGEFIKQYLGKDEDNTLCFFICKRC